MSNSTSFENLLPPHISATVKKWVDDDMPSFDVGGLVVGDSIKKAQLWMKSSGVFAGKPFVTEIFKCLCCEIRWEEIAKKEGEYIEVENGTKILIATVSGPVKALLQGERTALNTLSRCSGVATVSANAVRIARELNWNGYVAGTRKTTPGDFRIVEKYGLLVGGAATHRLDLSQMVMLKDNHIWSAGSITNAVKLARKAAGFSQKIEVECQSLEEALEAAKAGADIVMLDNFLPNNLKRDAQVIKEQFPHILIEASGGITSDTMPQYLSEHIDIVSQGKLTQGYNCIDFSLKIIP